MNNKSEKNFTIKYVCSDVLISIILIGGAWATSKLGDILFPMGIPFIDSILIYGRASISIMWILRMVVRHSVSTFNEINSAILTVINTQTWKASQGFIVNSIKFLWRYLKSMNVYSRYLVIIILIIGLSLSLFIFTQNLTDLWLPPAYGTAALLFAYIFERDSLTKPGARRYWLVILILFCIIQIAIGVGIVDVLQLNNANIWSEIWELIVQLPNTQLSTANNLRVLVSMSVMYIIADNIYQRHEAELVNYVENMKQVLDQAKRGMNWCYSLPALSMV